MSKVSDKENPRYQQGIEKITVTDATFALSTKRVIEPSWINFCYGNNGSGKTTIARTIRSGQGLTLKDGKSADEFVSVVFNQEFIAEELHFDLMPGVVMLSKDASDKQQEIDDKQKLQMQLNGQLQIANTALNGTQAKREKLKNDFETDCWKAAARYKKVFGGKGDLQSTAKCVARICKTEPAEHDFEDLTSRFETASDPNARRFDLLTPLDTSKLDAAEKFDLLRQSIVSSADTAFSRFMQALDATDWVRQGIHFAHKSEADGKCPFCQQSLPHEFEEQLASCFDSKYTEDCTRLADYQRRYADYMEHTFIEPLRRYIEYIPQIGFGDWKVYGEQLALIEKTVQVNNQKVAAKVEKPSESIELDSARPYIDAVNQVIAETNKLFGENNRIFDAKDKTREDCINKAWELLAFELNGTKTKYFAEDKKMGGEIVTKNGDIQTLQNSLNAIKNEIRGLTDKMGGTSATVDKINDLLEKTGFRGFFLRSHNKIPDKYEVIREDGSVAKGLSEGERNFIAFLYFYYYVQGAWRKEDLVKGKIVVIDDPVSSMDSGVLYIVGSLVRDLIEDCFCDGKDHNIKQIFILTHNPYFHKEVSHKYETNDDELVKKSAFFFVKKSDDNISTIEISETTSLVNESGTENVSPVKNSYDSLWCEYRDAKLPSTLLSVIQRIVEYHFLQLCSYKIDDLRERVEKYMGESAKKQRIAAEMLRFIYDEKHDIGDGINYAPDHDISVYKDVFGLIFEAMGQEQHFEKMSGGGV